MNKINQAVQSRTFWTVVVMVVLNSINANMQFIPVSVLPYINTILGIVAAYFHVNPSQNYGGPTA